MAKRTKQQLVMSVCSKKCSGRKAKRFRGCVRVCMKDPSKVSRIKRR